MAVLQTREMMKTVNETQNKSSTWRGLWVHAAKPTKGKSKQAAKPETQTNGESDNKCCSCAE